MNPFELTKDPDGGGITVRVKNNFVVPTREEERRATKRITEEIFAENEKLRELVRELYEDQCDECDCWKYRDRMRELGIEVK